MKSSRAREVLYDSETVLRLVDHELRELHDSETADAERSERTTAQPTPAAATLRGPRHQAR